MLVYCWVTVIDNQPNNIKTALAQHTVFCGDGLTLACALDHKMLFIQLYKFGQLQFKYC